MEEKKKYISSVKYKVILGFLLAISGFAIYYSVSRLALKDISDKIVQLSQPNEKLNILNGVFQDIIRIDQLQRQLAVLNQPKSRSVLFSRSEALKQNMDDYRSLILNDTLQISKLDSLQVLLENKDQLHISYLRTKSAFTNNKTFIAKIDSLSNLVEGSIIDESSDKITFQKKTTTTKVIASDTIRIEKPVESDKKPGFFQRIFSKKSDLAAESTSDEYVLMDKIIEEEFDLQIDSLSRTFQDTAALQNIQLKMAQLKEEQINRMQLLFDQELRYVNTGNELINYALTILQDIEFVEMQLLEQEGTHATQVAANSLRLNNILLLFFIVCGSILVFLILTDIAKARVFRIKLEEEKLRVEELSKVKERFLANVSHELKTPLQSIIGYTELLEKEPTSDNISIVKSSAEHLNYLVSDILDYSKVVSDKFELSHQAFDLKSVLDFAYLSQLPLVKDKSIDLILDCDFGNQEIIVMGDEFRLRQVLINLLNNAIKFTENGAVCLRAKVSNNLKGIYSLSLEVEDTGCGIDDKYQEVIFDYFEQIKDSDRQVYQKGTGLGLAIVKQLLARMNGTITLKSKLGEGALFQINLDLPIGSIENLKDLEGQLAETIFFEPSGIPPIHVIDDEPYILELIKNIFDRHQIQGYFYESADCFLASEPTRAIKFVITDLRMPGTNGIQLCEHLRAQPHTKNAHLIAITAQATPEQIIQLRHVGFDNILSKPFKKLELLNAIYQGNKLTTNLYEQEDSDIDFQIDKDLELLKQYTLAKETNLVIDLLHKLASRIGFAGDEVLSVALRQYELDLRKSPSDEKIMTSLLTFLEETIRESESLKEEKAT